MSHLLQLFQYHLSSFVQSIGRPGQGAYPVTFSTNRSKSKKEKEK